MPNLSETISSINPHVQEDEKTGIRQFFSPLEPVVVADRQDPVERGFEEQRVLAENSYRSEWNNLWDLSLEASNVLLKFSKDSVEVVSDEDVRAVGVMLQMRSRVNPKLYPSDERILGFKPAEVLNEAYLWEGSGIQVRVSPEQLVDRLFQIDTDINDKLIREVMTKGDGRVRRDLANYVAEKYKLSYSGDSDAETKLRELLSLIVIESATRGEGLALYLSIRALLEKGRQDEIEHSLYDSSLTKEARMAVAIQTIRAEENIIPTMDRLAHGANSDTREDVRAQLQSIYSDLNGSRVSKIFSELSGIYGEINYAEYARNNERLNQREVRLVVDEVLDHFYNQGSSDTEVLSSKTLLDIGAATGRNALPLSGTGLKKVIGFEYENHYVGQMQMLAKEKGLPLDAVEGDWKQLSTILEERGYPKGSIDIFISLNRTGMHNRMPWDMLHWFDEIGQIASADCIGIVDFPSTEVGVNAEEMNALRKNLEAYGIGEYFPFPQVQVFDGPDEGHKFHRLAVTDEQAEIYFKITGFRVVKKIESIWGNNREFHNKYYVIERDPNFDPEAIKAGMALYMHKLGIKGPAVPWEMRIESLDSTLKELVN